MKTIVVTGGTSGIGLAGAVELARRGHRIVLVARDPGRAEAALKRLRRVAPGIPHSVHIADLSRLSDMKRVGGAIAAAEPRIDVLINNAGAMVARRCEVEGIEKTFALDHLSYVVLTQALLPSLAAASPARIVSTASFGHRFAALDFDDLQNSQGYRDWVAYCRAKLCNVLFTRELARRLAGTGVTATCFDPGFVATRFVEGTSGVTRLAWTIGRPVLARTPDQGADTLVYLALAQEVEGRSGGYWARRKLATPGRAGRDDGAARRLWDASVDLIGSDV